MVGRSDGRTVSRVGSDRRSIRLAYDWLGGRIDDLPVFQLFRPLVDRWKHMEVQMVYSQLVLQFVGSTIEWPYDRYPMNGRTNARAVGRTRTHKHPRVDVLLGRAWDRTGVCVYVWGNGWQDC